MSPTGLHPRDQPYDNEHFGLDLVAQHNASAPESRSSVNWRIESATPYDDVESTRGSEPALLSNPLTPQSHTPSDGMRTRSGRATRRTESPYGVVRPKVTNSPAARGKRDKKNKLDKSKMPTLTAPLSILTRDMNVPLRDIEAWVNRPIEERKKEAEKRNGYITRPMNSFMLYRSAYAERTKQWCLQNNHQIVSSVSGCSWPMEPQEVRDQYDQWAKIERANHQAAHPQYKFSPSKPINKQRKAGLTDDDDDDDGNSSDFNVDPDADYGVGKSTRRRKRDRRATTSPPPTGQTFESLPYYGQQGTGYDLSRYPVMTSEHTLPSNIDHELSMPSFDMQANAYLSSNPYQRSQYPFGTESTDFGTDASYSLQTLGKYGLPSNQARLDRPLYGTRADSPLQDFGQYVQVLYPHHAMQYPAVYPDIPIAPVHGSMYRYDNQHPQYLPQISQYHDAIDPALEPSIDHRGSNRFEMDRLDDRSGDAKEHGPADSRDLSMRPTSPNDVNATLAPTWMADDL